MDAITELSIVFLIALIIKAINAWIRGWEYDNYTPTSEYLIVLFSFILFKRSSISQSQCLNSLPKLTTGTRLYKILTMNFIQSKSTVLESDVYCLETDGHSNKTNKNDSMVLMSDVTVTVATFMILIHSEE